MADNWRDTEGFGRDIEVSPGTWSAKGPDDEDHAIHCDFIKHKGILPCSCDFTRRVMTWWWQCWLRWQKARVNRYHSTAARDRVPWPIKGPDGDPWVAGIDYNDDEGGQHGN